MPMPESIPGYALHIWWVGSRPCRRMRHFRPTKDVDMHLIFDEGSPILTPRGPFPHVLETAYKGLMLEGGYKPITEYASAVVVLANPEIAHHLTVDSIL